MSSIDVVAQEVIGMQNEASKLVDMLNEMVIIGDGGELDIDVVNLYQSRIVNDSLDSEASADLLLAMTEDVSIITASAMSRVFLKHFAFN